MIPVNAAEHEREQAAQLAKTWRAPPGLRGQLAAVNNQRVGLRYMLTALGFFAIGGVLALLMRLQLAVSDQELIGAQVFNELFTMHGSTMMYLFAVPFLEGLALFLLPMLIGARDVAFPRLTAFSYWVYLGGGIIFYAAFAIGAVPDTGWFAYTPLSGPRFADVSIDFWLLGLSLVEIAGITAGIEIAVTALKFRAPGMTLARMPVLVWAFLVMAVMIIFAFTTLLTATVMLELDRALGTAFFNPDLGGSSLLWQHMFWFFGHPEVYIMFIPAVGVISMLVPVFARRALAGHTLVVLALVVTGFLSFGLWAHHMFTTGLPELALSFFTAASLMIGIATGTQIFAWIATLWGRRPSLEPPMLFVLGFLFVFVLGGITGVMIAVVPFNFQVHDTYFIVAHFHYVLIGGVVFPALGGLYYWWPKLSGRLPARAWGVASFWLMFIGFNATFFPMHLMGFFGLPRRVYTYSAELGLDGYNLAATIGAFVLAVGFGLYVLTLLASLRRGAAAPRDPWGGETLEWSVASPPPPYTFFRPPIVRSHRPLHEEAGDTAGDDPEHRAVQALAGRPVGWRATLVTSAAGARPQAVQWLPGPTFVPLYVAGAVFVVAVSTLAQFYALGLFAAVLAAGFVARWLRPVPDAVLAPGAEEIEVRSGLPVFSAGRQAVGWWGAVALLGAMGMALAALVFAYSYIQLFSEDWPMGGLPEPAVVIPLLGLLALAASVLPLRLGGRLARSGEGGGRQFYLLAAALGLVSGVAQVYVLATAGFLPQTNAYGSVFFGLHGLQLLYLVTATCVLLALAGWSFGEGISPRRRLLHVQIAEVLWYFVVVSGAIVVAVVHLSPYLV